MSAVPSAPSACWAGSVTSSGGFGSFSCLPLPSPSTLTFSALPNPRKFFPTLRPSLRTALVDVRAEHRCRAPPPSIGPPRQRWPHTAAGSGVGQQCGATTTIAAVCEPLQPASRSSQIDSVERIGIDGASPMPRFHQRQSQQQAILRVGQTPPGEFLDLSHPVDDGVAMAVQNLGRIGG